MFAATPVDFAYEDYDVGTQVAWSQHRFTIDGKVVTFSSPHRYVRPSELDLMARLAGITLRERWSDWDRRPFTSDSRSHVSVWEGPDDTAFVEA